MPLEPPVIRTWAPPSSVTRGSCHAGRLRAGCYGRAVSDVDRISDHYVDRIATLHPIAATLMGVAGHDDQMTDFSPDGIAERTTLTRSVLSQLRAVDVETERDRVARDVMLDEAELGLALDDAGERLRDLNIMHSPLQMIRQVFDLVPTETVAHWEAIAARLALVPQGLDGYRETLQAGAEQGLVAAQRQASACARQADTWGGVDQGGRGFFQDFV